jgi:hypothetical protein
VSDYLSCVLTDRHGSEMSPLPGLAVCGRCRAYLVRLIDEIQSAWPIVGMRVQPMRRERLEYRRMPFGPSSPANDYVLSLLDPRTSIPTDDGREPLSIPSVIAGWVNTIKAERGTATDGRRPSVAAGLAYLAVHVDHIAGAGWVVDAVDELAAVARHCRGLAGDRPPVTVRACPGVDGQPCPGQLKPDESGRALVCTRCDSAWPCSEWLDLAEPDRGPILASVSELAAFLSVPEGTIRYWASVEEWPRYGPRNARRYAISDAMRTHAARSVRLVS